MANDVLKTFRDTARRIAVVKVWKARLKRIKDAGISRRKFCLAHEISPENLCRYLKNQKTPEWSTIKTVNAALTKAIRALPRK